MKVINKNEVLLLFSGGVDSTVLLWLLGSSGMRVNALHTDHAYNKMSNTAEELVGRAQQEFGKDQIRYHYTDLSPIFKVQLTNDNAYLPGFRMWMYLAALSKADELGIWNLYSAELCQPFITCGDVDADSGSNMLLNSTGISDKVTEFSPAYRAEFVKLYGKMYKGRDLYYVLSEPFIGMSKPALIKLGKKLGAPLKHTMSCRNPLIEQLPKKFTNCGKSTCFTCCERKAGFLLAGVKDKTKYWDPHPVPKDYLEPLKAGYTFIK